MTLRRALSAHLAFVLAMALVLAAAGIGTGYIIQRLKSAAIAEALEIGALHARAFEDHVTRSLVAVEQLAGLLSASPGDLTPQRIDDFFRQALRQAPFLRSLSALDETGRVLASSHPANIGRAFDATDLLPPAVGTAAYLRIGRPWTGRDLHEGQPLATGMDGSIPGFIPLLYPMDLGDRRLMLLAALNPDFFLTHFHQRLETAQGFAELLRYDQTPLLSTAPPGRPDNRQTRSRIHGYLPDVESGRFAEPEDGPAPTLVAFRASRAYPLLVVTHLDRSQALARWRDETRRLLLVVSPSLAGLTLLATVLYHRQQQRAVRRTEARQRERERLAATVLDTVSEAVMVSGPDHRILTVNPAFSRITGYGAEEVVGRDPALLIGDEPAVADLRQQRQAVLSRGRWEGETRNRRKDGGLFVAWQSISVVRDEAGAVSHFVSGFTDITAYRVEADRSSWLAQHDPLTELPNRMLLTDRLQQAIRQARRDRTRLAVIFIDLDRFKPVNDSLGHAVGDRLLQAVAQRLLECVREADTVARLGGDEFVVLLPDIAAEEDVLRVARKIQQALNRPFSLPPHDIRIACSSGIALYPDHGTTAAALMQCADEAMYRVKATGGNGG